MLRSPDEVESAVIRRQPLWSDRRDETGPFDIIGDVHGCLDELLALFGELGYEVEASENDGFTDFDVRPPEGRTAVFVGDLVDRGLGALEGIFGGRSAPRPPPEPTPSEPQAAPES